MILTYEEMRKLKWLIPTNDGLFLFTGKGEASAEDVKLLLEFDKDNYEIFQGHIIVNYDDLLSTE